MIEFDSPVVIELDASRFSDDEGTRFVAEVVARHAEIQRKLYRAKEQPTKLGLLEIEGYWSDSVPWYEWMSEPEVLHSCADECGLKIWQLAYLIAYQIRPNNWQVFSWMGMALQGIEYEKEHLSGSFIKHAIEFKTMREKQRAHASEAGRASGKVRSEDRRCTPEVVAKLYQTLMATGTEKRNVATKLATRFNVTPDHIRRLLGKAKN